MARTGRGRGWNFRRGEKDAVSTEQAAERGAKGGRARVPKGFSAPDVLSKALETRKENGEKC